MAIRSIQRGTVVATGTSGTATITSVATERSRLVREGISNTQSGFDSVPSRLTFTDSTTITLNRIGSGGTNTGAFEVIEEYQL